MGTQEGYASVDGKRMPLDEGTVPITDRGFLYGDSVYDVFRTYSGVPLLGAEHWQRLLRSASLIQLRISDSMQELHAEVASTIAAWHKSGGTGDAYVRYTYTRGSGPINLYPAPDLLPLRVIIVKAIPEWPAHHYSEGLTLAIPSVRRNPINALNPFIKGGNYLNNVLGVLEARELGAEDCLMLNQKQYLTEASNSNVLFVIDEAVQTPSVESGILSGLTKGIVSELCMSAGISFNETLLSVNDIRSATECFVTSATREIIPVKSLRLEDGTLIKFPMGGGSVTRMLRSSYKDYVNSYGKENIDSCLF
ncbi:MAG: aminotransferase class IV [Gammaproteobacteria bacterium]|nr:aminotransferase class IV [Gammaproteobacteria bacterium]